ncbi:MAG: hypothetical protein D6694_12755 [Gammaproteobacteria bacterium]|nr:MAG: hypothetical protein D6694_12755 [Gammaproteobacteria bacterium]
MVYKQVFRHLILTDLWFLIRVVLGWHWFDEHLHGKILMRHWFGNRGEKEERDKLTLIPRGHIKTMMQQARLVQYILRFPNRAVLVASGTEDLAKDVGRAISTILKDNKILQELFPDILPNSDNPAKFWGAKGYSLPNRKPRTDPTLYCCSTKTNIIGRHPDLIVWDDIVVDRNNNPAGRKEVLNFVNQCKALLPPHGWIEALGTRYSDADIYNDIIEKKVLGNRGYFDCLIMSCYKNDDPNQGPIFPSKVRWNAPPDCVSGFSIDLLERKRMDMGAFFNAQYRNDPVPEEEQILDWRNIQTYKKGEEPPFSKCFNVAIEIEGGGKPIYEVIKEYAEEMSIDIPLLPIKRRRQVGVSKHDRIISGLEAIVNNGRLFLQDWMFGEDIHDTDSLVYEIRRIGAAKHDDIVDCLNNIQEYLVKDLYPAKGQPADMYMSVDLAYSEKKTSDYTVIMAVAVDSDGQYWVLDYDRFKIKSPRGIAERVIRFYNKWNAVAVGDNADFRGKNFAATYNFS